VIHVLTALVVAADPIDWSTTLGTLPTQVLAGIQTVLPLGIPVFATLAVLSIGLAVFRKFGIKR